MVGDEDLRRQLVGRALRRRPRHCDRRHPRLVCARGHECGSVLRGETGEKRGNGETGDA